MTISTPAACSSLLIFDGELTSVSGHWFGYDQAVAAIARPHGITTSIMANVAFKGSEHLLEAEGVEVDPVIRYSAYRNFIGYADRGLIMEHVGLVLLALSNCRAILHHLRGRRYDCVFVPAVHLSDVLTWTLLGLIGVFGKVGRLVLLVRYDILDHTQANPVPARKQQLWRWLFRLMHKCAAPGQVVLLADSARLSEEYLLVSGLRGQPVPSPRIIAPGTVQRGVDKATITFGMTGLARYEKGIDLFVGAIEEILAGDLAPNARFLVQFDQPIDLPDGQVLLCPPELAASPRVEILDHILSEEEYSAAFDRIDCMVLPYRREFYAARTSGVAVEAACADIPMIYTADSWLDVFASEQGAGIAVPSGDQAAVRDAIVAIAADWLHYAQAAVVSGEKARARNGGDAFLTILLERPV